MAFILDDDVLLASVHGSRFCWLGMMAGVHFLQATFGFPLLPADDILNTLMSLIGQTFDPLLCGRSAESFRVLEFLLDILYCWLVEILGYL